MSDLYKTISGISQGIYKEKGSKFISYSIPVKDEKEVKKHLNSFRKEHHNARHCCYAWATGHQRENSRMSDDGEPSGTAGKPIYGQILSYDITDVLIAVVRYFGGVKLGTGGLITAYKNAAAEALNNSEITTKILKDVYRVHFDYPLMDDIMRILKENQLEQVNRRFELDCYIDFQIKKKDKEKIIPLFNSLNINAIKYLYTE